MRESYLCYDYSAIMKTGKKLRYFDIKAFNFLLIFHEKSLQNSDIDMDKILFQDQIFNI